MTAGKPGTPQKKYSDRVVALRLVAGKGKKLTRGLACWKRIQWRCPTAYVLRVYKVCAALYNKMTISARFVVDGPTKLGANIGLLVIVN